MSTDKMIALQFRDMHTLWRFAKTLTSPSMEINTDTKTMIFNCSTEEVNLAITNYGAKILEGNFVKREI
jgi:hypothetical protein